jgi:glycosyltransferase involved in cell wall biosynthesis
MPGISIIVPTFNRAQQLAKTMTSIAREVDPANTVEIIVVDNGSTDVTAATYNMVRREFPKHEWLYIHEPMPGLLSGRHRGAKEAQGEILAFIDDDVVLSASWLDGLVHAFSNQEVALVGGPSLPEYEVEPPEWLEALWHYDADGRRTLGALSLIDSGPAMRAEDPLYVWGLNFSIRKVVFDGCGGFHPDSIPAALQRYQGDGETGLSLKVKSAGFRAVYHPRVAVKHVIPASRMTLESLERRGFYQGVCDSYTQIRRDHGLPTAPPRSWRDVVRSAKWKLERDLILRGPTAEGVRRLMARSYFAGVRFHRNEVRTDPKLLDWVLRENYFDYRLPDGWKNYLNLDFSAAQARHRIARCGA